MASFAQLVATRRRSAPARRKQKRTAAQRIPRNIELAFLEFILADLDRLLVQVRARIISKLPRLAGEAKVLDSASIPSAARTDAPQEISEELAAMKLTLRGSAVERLQGGVASAGQRTAAAQEKSLRQQIHAAIGIEVPLRDPAIGQRLQAWTAENVARITTIEEQFLGDVEGVVLGGLTRGKRWEEIAETIQERFGVSESRAELIARDQVGKFYGAVQKARQEELGVVAYFWRTSLDERVRPEHAAREGQRYEWGDPPEDGYPGEAINCRCTAEPDLSPLLEDL